MAISLDDWDDLSPSSVTPIADPSTGGFLPAFSGINAPGEASSKYLNAIQGGLRLGSSTAHIILDGDNNYIGIGNGPPSSYGNNDGIWMGLESNVPKISIYKDASNYIQYDGTNVNIAAKKVYIKSGGDIELEGHASDPGVLIFKGTSYTTELGTNATGSTFAISPQTAGQTQFMIGSGFYGEAFTNFYADFTGSIISIDQELDADNQFHFNTVLSASSVNEAWLTLENGGITGSYRFRSDTFGPKSDSDKDLAASDLAWNDAWAVNWDNPADFYYLDKKDDLGIIMDIKPNSKIEKRTGLPLIDDNTLPEWMLVKDKFTRKVVKSFNNKPWVSSRMMFSLLMGAIRQLNKKIEQLEGRIV